MDKLICPESCPVTCKVKWVLNSLRPILQSNEDATYRASQKEGNALARLQCAEDLRAYTGVEVRCSSVQVPDPLHQQLLLHNKPTKA